MTFLAIVATVLLAVSTPAQEARDWRIDIVEGDWTFVGESDGVVSLARRLPTDSRLIEFRYEYRDDVPIRQFANIVEAYPVYLQLRSTIALVEVDCDGMRRRPVRETLYPGRNLTGEVLFVREMNRPWAEINAGSLGSQQFAWACPAVN